MRDYTVTWVIELMAESPEAAAEEAREIQLDPKNIATHFTVFDDESGEEMSITVRQA